MMNVNEMDAKILENVTGGFCPPDAYEHVAKKIAEEEERRRLGAKVGDYGGAGGKFSDEEAGPCGGAFGDF